LLAPIIVEMIGELTQRLRAMGITSVTEAVVEYPTFCRGI
jgi:hypothetical protein